MESDLLEVMVACTDNYLDTIDLQCKKDTAATVIAASSGYPGPPAKNDTINIDHSGKSWKCLFTSAASCFFYYFEAGHDLEWSFCIKPSLLASASFMVKIRPPDANIPDSDKRRQ